MLAVLGFALVAFISTTQNAQCKTGQVLGVEHGRDYILNVCGAGLVALPDPCGSGPRTPDSLC